jgi:hypothetical protein
VRGVDSVDVEARIGFGKAQPLRIGEHLAERRPVSMRRQDVIAGAVEDAVDPLDAVGGGAFAQSP